MIEQHYTADEVAELLKVSVFTVLRLAKPPRCELRSVMVGRSRRFPESAIRAYLGQAVEDEETTASVLSMQGRR